MGAQGRGMEVPGAERQWGRVGCATSFLHTLPQKSQGSRELHGSFCTAGCNHPNIPLEEPCGCAGGMLLGWQEWNVSIPALVWEEMSNAGKGGKALC